MSSACPATTLGKALDQVVTADMMMGGHITEAEPDSSRNLALGL